jgi:transcriptional regulator with XRE-family HTH domain
MFRSFFVLFEENSFILALGMEVGGKMEYGEAFRILRKEKRKKQEEVAQNLIKRGTLSRFENGHGNVRLEVFFAMLERIEVTPNQFYAFYRDQNHQKEHAIPILELAEKLKKKFEREGVVDEKEAALLRSSLFDREQWRILETKAYIETLFLYPYDLRTLLHRRVLLALDKTYDTLEAQKYRMEYFIGIIVLHFESEEYDILPERIEEMSRYVDKENVFFGYLWFRFFERLYLYTQTDSRKEVEEILRFVYTLKAFSYADAMRRIYHNSMEKKAQKKER